MIDCSEAMSKNDFRNCQSLEAIQSKGLATCRSRLSFLPVGLDLGHLNASEANDIERDGFREGPVTLLICIV